MVMSTFRRQHSTAGDVLPLQSYQTTGSMAAGSNQLVVASNPGFAIGNTIIVATGGEAGGGLRASVGVGGSWPSLSYVNEAAMVADTSKPEGQFCWLEDTKVVWRYVSGTWIVYFLEIYYYLNRVVPKALIATITNIVGNTFTLSTAATVATTGAAVHYDNAPSMNALMVSGAATPTNKTLIIPTGRFAVGARLELLNHVGWTLRGQGMDNSILFSPSGAMSAHLVVQISNSTLVRDFAIEGNARQNGYGLQYTAFGGATPILTDTVFTQGTSFPGGVLFSGSSYSAAMNVRCTDVFQKAVAASFSNDTWAYNCEAFVTEPIREYVQWQFQWADCNGGGFVDCRVDSPWLTTGFESFRSVGTQMIRCVGRNAAMSCNSAGNWLIDSPVLTIEANSQFDDVSFSKDNPLINVNSNVNPPSGSLIHGGRIRNPRIITQGAINGSGDVCTAININALTTRITVTGGYPSTPSQGGYIQHPTAAKLAALGINSTGTYTTIDGIRVVGTNTNSAWGNIKVASTGTIKNCVSDVIPAGGTQTGNQTNAAYIAGGGT